MDAVRTQVTTDLSGDGCQFQAKSIREACNILSSTMDGFVPPQQPGSRYLETSQMPTWTELI